MVIHNLNIALLVTAVALFVSALVYPHALRFARRHNIVDNPNARKLQRVPVPVFGGIVVFMGIIAGMVVLSAFLHDTHILVSLLAMAVMLAVGVWDDIRNLSAVFRLVVEIGMVGMVIYATGSYIDSFHGLWGLWVLSDTIAVPLSVVAGVGIINAVNLIDGVDGYSSGFGMLACACFAVIFMEVWRPVWVCLTMVVVASLVPFFLHNVFGRRSKMFIGDGGTLMLGMLMTVFVFETLSSHSRCANLADRGVGLAALTLSVLCIPVFDTLRVMTARMLRGHSPFSPDKTHLHHLFIDMGFSHLGAAMSILLINTLVVAAWLLAWSAGASVDVQFYVVVLLGLLVTTGFYKLMKSQQNGGRLDEDGYPEGTWLWRSFCRLGELSHFEKGRLWKLMTRIMDSQR